MLKKNSLLLLSILSISCLAGCNSSKDELSSIEVILNKSETVYMVEDSFKRPTVFAHYSKSGVHNVSKDVRVSGYNMNEAGEQEVTVTYENKTTTYKIGVFDNEYDCFSSRLTKYEGHTNKKVFTVKRTNGYLTTGSDFLTVTLKDTGASSRYKRGNSYLVNTTGTAAYINDDGSVSDSSKYQTQIYDDQVNYYKITTYPKLDWENSYKKIAYSKETEEINYNIGFASEDIVNAAQMKSFVGDINYGINTINFEGKLDDDNVWNYGYTLTIYEIETGGQRNIHATYDYDTKLTIENGLGTHLEQVYTYTEYYGGVAAAYIKAESSIDYEYGEYSEFTGKLLPYVEEE